MLGIMLNSELVWYKHYYLWCDEIIEHSEHPPFWIIELATVKYLPKATKIVNEYVYSEPFEQFNNRNNLYIACLFLRYERQEISWATFLTKTGEYSDGNSSKKNCEYFYDMLNKFEDSEYSNRLERNQKSDVKNIFISEISEMQRYYDFFIPYFRRYVRTAEV